MRLCCFSSALLWRHRIDIIKLSRDNHPDIVNLKRLMEIFSAIVRWVVYTREDYTATSRIMAPHSTVNETKRTQDRVFDLFKLMDDIDGIDVSACYIYTPSRHQSTRLTDGM